MNFLGTDHPFYRPLWRRLVLIGVVAGWFLFELLGPAEPFWMVIAGGLLAVCVWAFLITYPKA
jgi:hypothetical protein